MEIIGFVLALLFACLAFVQQRVTRSARLNCLEAIGNFNEATLLNERLISVNRELQELVTGWKNLAEDWRDLCYEASGTVPAK